MEKQASSKNVMLTYGLILGVVSIIINLSMYAANLHVERDWKFGVAGFIAMIIIIVMGIKKFKYDNIYLSFGQAVKIGVGIALISALISILYNYVFANFIEPDYMNQIFEYEKAKWIEQDLSAEQMEGAEKMFQTFSSPAIGAAIGIVSAAFIGFVISAIAGAIMKKSEQDAY
jgi:membrane-associated HD superfamily phosphohydrolase